jgi:hypothetical protein
MNNQPAFPSPAGVAHITDQGMTLRDYFAAKCFSKVGSFPETIKLDYDGTVRNDQHELFQKYIKAFSTLAYEMADAMIEAREKNNG